MNPEVAPVEVEDDLDWQRMHPVTPALKGWKLLLGLLVVAWAQLENVQEGLRHVHGRGWLVVAGGLALFLLVGFAYSTVAWRMTRFAVTDEAVHLRTGVLFRQQRQARLDRLQAVDVVQPLLARLVGLSELKLEVAGGAESAVSLAFLRESDAEALRVRLLALAAGRRAVPTAVPGVEPASTPSGAAPEVTEGAAAQVPAPAPAALSALPADVPEQPVYEVPMGRLLPATLLSGAMIWLVVGLVVAGVLMAVSREVGSVLVVAPAVLGTVGAVWGRINQGAGFRAAVSPDGIRLRHGLTESRTQTVPPGRVQAIRVTQPLLWRKADWWRVQINVAGYAGTEDAEHDTVLHPVASREEAMTAIWLVLPDLGVEDPRAVLTAAFSGQDEDGGFTAAPRRARWVDPVGWRRRGVLVTGRALLARSGRVWRQVDVVPHERTQSLGLAQGPLQRRLGLASFVVHSTPGPVSPQVAHLDAITAAELLDEQSHRARRARAGAGPEQWSRTEPDGLA
ncbi:PH domain-containing protein [Cellulomonas soli]|uniref:PH domain-containing protein n=1 Tax=Cellulomonas soli TaxID=931535 RepID=UPI003F8305A8